MTNTKPQALQKILTFLLILCVVSLSFDSVGAKSKTDSSSSMLAPKTVLITVKSQKSPPEFWKQYLKNRWKVIAAMIIGSAALSGIVNTELLDGIFHHQDVSVEMVKGTLTVAGAVSLFYQGAKEQQIFKEKNFQAFEKAENRLELKALFPTLVFTRLLSYLWLTHWIAPLSSQAMTITLGTLVISPWIVVAWIAILIPVSYYFANNKNYFVSNFPTLQWILPLALVVPLFLTLGSNIGIIPALSQVNGIPLTFSQVGVQTILDLTVFTIPYLALSVFVLDFFKWAQTPTANRISWKEFSKNIKSYFVGPSESEKTRKILDIPFVFAILSFWLFSVPIVYLLFLYFDGIFLFIMFSIVEALLSPLYTYLITIPRELSNPVDFIIEKDKTSHIIKEIGKAFDEFKIHIDFIKNSHPNLREVDQKIKADRESEMLSYFNKVKSNLENLSRLSKETQIQVQESFFNKWVELVNDKYRYKPVQIFISLLAEYMEKNDIFSKDARKKMQDSLQLIHYRNPYIFLDILKTTDLTSDEYRDAFFILAQSRRIDMLPLLLQIWNDFPPSDLRRQDIEFLFLEIPQWEITEKSNGPTTIEIRRTTYSDRYRETIDPLIFELVKALYQKGIPEIRSLSVASSNGLVDIETFQGFEKFKKNAGIPEAILSLKPSDLRTRFHLLQERKTGNYYTLKSNGEIIAGYQKQVDQSYIQIKQDDKVRHIVQGALTAFTAFTKNISISTLLNDPKLNLENQSFHIQSVSLMHPEVQNTLETAEELNFFELPDTLHLSHLIIARGIVAYEPGTGYWDVKMARQILANLGNKLEDGGYLIVAAGAFSKTESEMFDVYQKEGDILKALSFEDIKLLLKTHPLLQENPNFGNITDRLLSGFGYYQGPPDQIVSEDVLDWEALKEIISQGPPDQIVSEDVLDWEALKEIISQKILNHNEILIALNKLVLSDQTDIWSKITSLQNVTKGAFKKIGLYAHTILKGQEPVGPTLSLKSSAYTDPFSNNEDIRKAA